MMKYKSEKIKLTIFDELDLEWFGDPDYGLNRNKWEWLKRNKNLLEECLTNRMKMDCYMYEYYDRFIKELIDNNYKEIPLQEIVNDMLEELQMKNQQEYSVILHRNYGSNEQPKHNLWSLSNMNRNTKKLVNELHRFDIGTKQQIEICVDKFIDDNWCFNFSREEHKDLEKQYDDLMTDITSGVTQFDKRYNEKGKEICSLPYEQEDRW